MSTQNTCGKCVLCLTIGNEYETQNSLKLVINEIITSTLNLSHDYSSIVQWNISILQILLKYEWMDNKWLHETFRYNKSQGSYFANLFFPPLPFWHGLTLSKNICWAIWMHNNWHPVYNFLPYHEWYIKLYRQALVI